MSLIRGRVWKYGDSVNTDLIFPGKYTYTVTDPVEIGRHALEDLDPAFAANVQPGDVIVAGRNWGCGSSREQAAACLKQNRVGAIVAASFARIFFRNAINNGLALIICPEAVASAQAGESIEVSMESNLIRLPAGEFTFPPLSPSVLSIVQAGGLINMLRARLGQPPLDEAQARVSDGGS